MTQADNEKELILGNKQLISLFFLVVAMCGAFFAFGYMIGRNGTKTATTAADAATPSTGSGDTPAAPSPVADAAPSSPSPDSPMGGDPPPPVTETQPARDTPATAPAATHSSPSPTLAPAVTPAPLTAPVLDASGTYLQVTALRRLDADNLVKTLREQNLPALAVESSKPDLFRVLVGPYRQMTQVADAKAKLKTLGFANAFVQK